MFAEERLRQLGMSDPSSRSYKAGDLSDPEQQLRYHLQQLEASQASSGRKPSNMVRVINSFNIQSVSCTETLFVFVMVGLKHNAGTLLTPVSDTVFYALSHCTLGFSLHGSSFNHFLIGGNFSTAKQIL